MPESIPGSLSDTFASIRQLTTRDEKFRDKLISISLYPVIVLAIAAIIVYQLATGPLPQLGKVLEYFKGELPWQSKLTIELGKFIGAYPLVYLSLYLGPDLPAQPFARLDQATPALHQWVLKVPFVENLVLASIRANFIQTLATLKKSKVDNLKCLLLLQGISWCYPYRAAITRGYRRVANGEALAVALEEEVDILGQRTIEYLRVLEETGADVAMLERLAVVMNRDLDSTIGRAEAVAKPLIIVFLAAIIGVNRFCGLRAVDRVVQPSLGQCLTTYNLLPRNARTTLLGRWSLVDEGADPGIFFAATKKFRPLLRACVAALDTKLPLKRITTLPRLPMASRISATGTGFSHPVA